MVTGRTMYTLGTVYGYWPDYVCRMSLTLGLKWLVFYQCYLNGIR